MADEYGQRLTELLHASKAEDDATEEWALQLHALLDSLDPQGSRRRPPDDPLHSKRMFNSAVRRAKKAAMGATSPSDGGAVDVEEELQAFTRARFPRCSLVTKCELWPKAVQRKSVLEPLNTSELTEALDALDESRPAGRDGLEPRALRRANRQCEAFRGRFFRLLDRCLRQGTLPDQWKESRVAVVPVAGSCSASSSPSSSSSEPPAAATGSYQLTWVPCAASTVVDTIVAARFRFLCAGKLPRWVRYGSALGVTASVLEKGRNTLRAGRSTACAVVDMGASLQDMTHIRLGEEFRAHGLESLGAWMRSWLFGRVVTLSLRGTASPDLGLGLVGFPLGAPLPDVLPTLCLNSFFRGVNTMPGIALQGAHGDRVFVVAEAESPDAASAACLKLKDGAKLFASQSVDVLGVSVDANFNTWGHVDVACSKVLRCVCKIKRAFDRSRQWPSIEARKSIVFDKLLPILDEASAVLLPLRSTEQDRLRSADSAILRFIFAPDSAAVPTTSLPTSSVLWREHGWMATERRWRKEALVFGLRTLSSEGPASVLARALRHITLDPSGQAPHHLSSVLGDSDRVPCREAFFLKRGGDLDLEATRTALPDPLRAVSICFDSEVEQIGMPPWPPPWKWVSLDVQISAEEDCADIEPGIAEDADGPHVSVFTATCVRDADPLCAAAVNATSTWPSSSWTDTVTFDLTTMTELDVELRAIHLALTSCLTQQAARNARCPSLRSRRDEFQVQAAQRPPIYIDLTHSPPLAARELQAVPPRAPTQGLSTTTSDAAGVCFGSNTVDAGAKRPAKRARFDMAASSTRSA
ncbi:uncharacterized protein PSFLO_04271 [Pseudozyma flocculosa]|uniref:Reverse transcriptase domain-containing protein n=1 Tax=Pseudozyma flocculosa TaxID=84751 RepID=A0A5C3F383_9BASI|nr:uncharacterized protein PSFLO_04271 [Pseudozyma flocculosa]